MSASKGPDIEGMAVFVAQQIHKHVSPDEDWGDLSTDEQGQFELIALAAVGAHDAWMAMKGFRLVPPGTVIKPASREEAGAMLRACEGYLKKNPPALVTPPRSKLITGTRQ